MWRLIFVLALGFTARYVGSLSIVEHVAEPAVVARCTPVVLTCRVDVGADEGVDVWWTFKGENASKLPHVSVDEDPESGVWRLTLACPLVPHSGAYSCFVQARNDTEVVYKKDASFQVYVPISISVEDNTTALDVGAEAELRCRVTSHPTASVRWLRDGGVEIPGSNLTSLGNHTVLATLRLDNVTRQDNGTYTCAASNEFGSEAASQDLLILEPPEVELELVDVVDPRTVHLVWSLVHSGNLPVQHYTLQLRNLTADSEDPGGGGSQWTTRLPRTKNTTATIGGLSPGVLYLFRLSATNDVGTSRWAYLNVTMPPDVPPRVSWLHVLASTNETLLFGWRRPLHDNGAPILIYQVQLSRDGVVVTSDSLRVNSTMRNNHMFLFYKLTPGLTYSFQVQACNIIGCGNWSEQLEGATSDGVADPPENVEIQCIYDRDTQKTQLVVTWDLPLNPRGSIQGYNVSMEGTSRYRTEEGKIAVDSFAMALEVKSDPLEYTAVIRPNTNYTVRVGTINKAGGGPLSPLTTKTICATPPGVPETVPHFTLQRLNSSQNFRQLKLELRRVSERNGPIRCYRIVVVRLKTGEALPEDPLNLTVETYQDVMWAGWGAYLAESFSSAHFLKEVILGDGRSTSCDPLEDSAVEDGQLAPLTNYTGFVVVEVIGPNQTELYKASPYFTPIETGALPTVHPTESPLAVIFGVVCGVIFVLFLCLIVLFILRYKTGSSFLESGEYFGLTALIIRTLQRNGHITRGKGGALSKLPPAGPILADDLPSAFLERHADSDLLFQIEFDSLPEKFKDRTTVASDAPENLCKNRYPDIKAYDQTRVQLKPIDGIIGSDYINANFVQGYKGNKTFICAQGPLPRTIGDFWRMIWEHGVTVVVMLTCTEEHGKMKCAEYWREDGEHMEVDKMFQVTQASRKTYFDYVMRRFTVKHILPSAGPVGYYGYLQEGGETPDEEREVLHFHYTQWRDFLAPEQPSWLLHFIKRVNEHYCSDRGPLLVHCSAGVGRTGTLVAIDSLLQQLEEEGQVDIYGTVAGLRRQRNFLVQCMKQYMFVYRALLEAAQFGDTEVEVQHLREHYLSLKEMVPSAKKTGLQLEFEKLSEVIEDVKPSTVGTKEVNKNRYDFIFPYDCNRVLLSPSPYGNQSAYINASFIQGYDRVSRFIITQDPLENTTVEFWRMVLEHHITILVTLSEMGEGQTKCQQFWPDLNEEKEWDYVQVKATAIESPSPRYIRRTFTVKNTKNGEEHVLVQLHFQEWAGVQVPEQPLSLVALIEEVWALSLKDSSQGTLAVHCSGGGERSSVFVTLYVLLQQLGAEKRVDVFQAARHTRAQRPCMLQTLGQYEFLYRTLVEYIDAKHIGNMGDTLL